MKLKTDTFYKTRDGRKAYVNCSKPCKAGVSYNGVIVGDEEFYCWYINGRLDSEEKTGGDLVSEWVDEPFHLEIGKRYKTRNGRIAFIASKYYDGTFLGMMKGYSTWFWWNPDGSNNEENGNLDLVECIDD